MVYIINRLDIRLKINMVGLGPIVIPNHKFYCKFDCREEAFVSNDQFKFQISVVQAKLNLGINVQFQQQNDII